MAIGRSCLLLVVFHWVGTAALRGLGLARTTILPMSYHTPMSISGSFAPAELQGICQVVRGQHEIPARIGPVAQLADGKTGNSLYAVVSGKIHGELLKFDPSRKVFQNCRSRFLGYIHLPIHRIVDG